MQPSDTSVVAPRSDVCLRWPKPFASMLPNSHLAVFQGQASSQTQWFGTQTQWFGPEQGTLTFDLKPSYPDLVGIWGPSGDDPPGH